MGQYYRGCSGTQAFFTVCLLWFSFVINTGTAAGRTVQNLPYLQLDFYHIKTPQLIGIIAGCLVFTVTISTVFYLLYESGTLGRAWKEIADDASAKSPAPTHTVSATRSSPDTSPQFTQEPELYDHLLKARETLPAKVVVPEMSARLVKVRALANKKDEAEQDLAELYAASNGSPVFHESAYSPERIWGWLEKENDAATPWQSMEAFTSHLQWSGDHVVIIDKEFRRAIGLISLVENCPQNLTIRIGTIWITPAFQGTKRAHEALFLVIKWLVESGYRRIVCQVNERHWIARKFLQRAGFLLEATMRKHRIVQRRNCNTAVYVMLNSDFQSIEDKLRLVLGLEKPTKGIPIASLPTAIDRSALIQSNANGKTTEEGKGGKNRKKRKNKQKKAE
eukprot:gene6433-7095_t